MGRWHTIDIAPLSSVAVLHLGYYAKIARTVVEE